MYISGPKNEKKNRSYRWKYLKKVNIFGFEIPNATAAILYLDLWKSIAIVHIFFVQTNKQELAAEFFFFNELFQWSI